MGLTGLVAPATAAAQEPPVVVTALDPAFEATPAFQAARAALGSEQAPARSRAEARRRVSQAVAQLTLALRAEGYYAAHFETDTAVSAPFRSTVIIDPGPLFVIEAVRVETEDTALLAILQAALGDEALRPGDAARTAPVLATEARLVAAARAAGWPDAQAGERQVVVDHDTNTMRIGYVVNAGDAGVIGPIINAGPAPARARFLRHVLGDVGAAPADPAVLDAMAARLRETNAYARVSVRYGSASATDGPVRPILVELEDAPRHTLSFGGGYDSAQGVRAEALWARRNIAARAMTLEVRGLVGGLERSIEADLIAPHAGRIERTAQLIAGAENAETDAFDRNAGRIALEVEQPLSDRIQVALGVDVEHARVEEPDDVTQTTEGDDFTFASVSAGAVYSTLDDVLNPQTGMRLEATLRPSVPIGGDAERHVIASLVASGYVPAPGLPERADGTARLVLAGRARVGVLLGADASDIPADRRFYAGGGGSVRGYEFQGVGPRQRDVDGTELDTPEGGGGVLELSGEARVRLSQRWGAAAFVDAGTVTSDAEISTEGLRAGAGIGARYYTSFGPLRADIAVPLARDEDDPSFQVYISIGQAF